MCCDCILVVAFTDDARRGGRFYVQKQQFFVPLGKTEAVFLTSVIELCDFMQADLDDVVKHAA
jgi:hypothetical protein